MLRPGGRVGISDVVAEDRLTPADRADRGSHVGCIAGALSESEYREGLTAVGLTDVEVELTHRVADGMHGAIIRARKPDSSRLAQPSIVGVAGGFGGPMRSLRRCRKNPPASRRPPTRMNENARATELSSARS